MMTTAPRARCVCALRLAPGRRLPQNTAHRSAPSPSQRGRVQGRNSEKAKDQLGRLTAILEGQDENGLLAMRAPVADDGTSKPIFSVKAGTHTRPIDRLSAPRHDVEEMALHERVEMDGMRNLVRVRACAACLRHAVLFCSLRSYRVMLQMPFLSASAAKRAMLPSHICSGSMRRCCEQRRRRQLPVPCCVTEAAASVAQRAMSACAKPLCSS
jgi:hypothetical protein